ncbi:MAG: hypothetical protein AAGF85_15545 [Bacteroidota bacterium]
MDMGFGKFYFRTFKEYLKYGAFNTYSTPDTLEYGANTYALKNLGYYYNIYGQKRTSQ